MELVKSLQTVRCAFLLFISAVLISEINCQAPPPPYSQYQHAMPAPPSFLEGLRRYIRQWGVDAPPNFGIGTTPIKQAHCYRKCKAGNVLVTRRGHIPRYNGCGSYGFETAIVPAAGWFTDCCNRHDLCYDTCGSNKVDCDMEFQSCLYGRCGLSNGYEAVKMRQHRDLPPGPYDNCLSHADLIATGPIVAGCMAFQRAQKNSCDCVPMAY